MKAYWLPSLCLASVCFAQGEPPEANDELSKYSISRSYQALARDLHQEAQTLTEKARYPEALKALQSAVALDDQNSKIMLSLAYVHQLLGHRHAAERRLRLIIDHWPEHADARLKLASLLTDNTDDPGALNEAKRLLEALRQTEGSTPRILAALARACRRLGLRPAAESLHKQLLNKVPLTDALALEIGEFYETLGDLPMGIQWYRRAVLTDAGRRKAARAIHRLELERSARKFGWSQPQGILPKHLTDQLKMARRLMDTGRHRDAMPILENLKQRVPTHGEIYGLIGDIQLHLGQSRLAEQSYLNAVLYDSTSARSALRLGAFYESTQEWIKAAEFLKRALTLRPNWRDVQVRRIKALWAAGNIGHALHETQTALSTLAEDEPSEELSQLKDTLTKKLPVDRPTSTEFVSFSAQAAKARRYLRAGSAQEALAMIQLIPLDKRSAAESVLEGAVLERLGQSKGAIESYRRALSIQPRQPEATEALGLILYKQGQYEQATPLLERAARNGSAEAALRQIERQTLPLSHWTQMGDIVHWQSLQDAQNRLRQMHSDPRYAPHERDIKQLLSTLDARLRTVYLIVCIAFFVILAWPIYALYRRHKGLTVIQFLDRAPGASVDIQRILSAIRHEVLKHNTTALSGLINAIEDGSDPVDRVSWMRKSLLGDDTVDGAIARLDGYAEQLNTLARTHRCQLNLQYKDNAVGAIIRGFSILERRVKDFENIAAGAPIKQTFITALRRASGLINGQGYRAVVHCLHHLRILTVDTALIDEIFDSVRQEPAFEDMNIDPLELAETERSLPCELAIPLQDFEDCVRNPIRNAIQATDDDETQHTAILVSIQIHLDVEPITGLSYLVIRILDRAQKALPLNAINEGSVEGGLGLTRQLMKRYDGQITVEAADAPWTKSVTLRFPIVEGASTEWNV